MQVKDRETLELAMRRKIPQAQIMVTRLPLVPEIQLALIDGSYSQADLSAEQVAELMNDPPYWSFCWASGQVMARYLLDNPHAVRGRAVVDFGSGSGVAAIAAALAGAARVIAVDIDQNALVASRCNAELNRVIIETAQRLSDIDGDRHQCVLLIADVFYDAENLTMLSGFIRDFGDVIVADSRVKPESLCGVRQVQTMLSCTVPDLAEAGEYNSVTLYRV